MTLHSRAPAGRTVVTLIPITHTPPADPTDAIELPAKVKAHLGLDAQRSWIVVTETNDFIWPGYDLRRVPGASPARFDYGMLPARLFLHLRDGILRKARERRLQRVSRDDD